MRLLRPSAAKAALIFLAGTLLALALPSLAHASGGTCPSASTYMEPVYGNTTGTLSSFGVSVCNASGGSIIAAGVSVVVNGVNQ